MSSDCAVVWCAGVARDRILGAEPRARRPVVFGGASAIADDRERDQHARANQLLAAVRPPARATDPDDEVCVECDDDEVCVECDDEVVLSVMMRWCRV